MLLAFALGLIPAAATAQAPSQPNAVEEKKDAPKDPVKEVDTKASDALVKGDTAWMLISTALVMLMVPGLALFYGGMVRRKNVLATMMHSMACLSLVGVFWIVIGYSLAFGDPWLKIGGASIVGFSPELVCLRGVEPTALVPNTNIPVYLHMLFQGMFAIITPALISGALAERIRFKPYCAFVLIWVGLLYCPLAHCVWAMDFNWSYSLRNDDEKAKLVAAEGAKLDDAGKKALESRYADSGKNVVGYLGRAPEAGGVGALDFAGGTVVHIAAGLSSLGAILVLRRRRGYPVQAFHPNSMVLTLTGAGLLWFGWFGFNGGSALGSGTLATSAFAATQAAAAGAGLTWMLAEMFHRGKPTALGLASGIVAGLVAVTPASGFTYPGAGLLIGLISGVVCYVSVNLKSVFKYDDSLDAFGVHGVGGFLGAVLTGVFCSKTINSAGFDAGASQVWAQFVAAGITALVGLVATAILCKLIDATVGFVADDEDEVTGLDRTEHGETGFDLGLALESVGAPLTMEPRAAATPPVRTTPFKVLVAGESPEQVMKVWSALCQPNASTPGEFKTIYPNLTTVQQNRFSFRGGNANQMRDALKKLLEGQLKKGIEAKIEK